MEGESLATKSRWPIVEKFFPVVVDDFFREPEAIVNWGKQLPKEVVNKGLGTFLGQLTKTYIFASTGQEIKKFSLISAWVVSQYQGEYNPSHWHDGHISGAGYLKLPKSFGKNVQKNKAQNYNGHINFIHGSRQFLSKSIQTVKPDIGNIYLFPNYLMHSVNPFYGEGERRSLSFNAFK